MEVKFAENNSTNFYLSLKQNFAKITDEFKKEKHVLLYHQYLVNQYIANNPEFRGMLIYHTVGTGKTMLGVSIADLFHKKEPDRQIVILAAKSLQANFQKDVNKYLDIEYSDKPADFKEKYMDDIKFVSLNASNMFTQVKKINESKEEQEFEKRLGQFMEKIAEIENLENTLLIVDEAHNLFNSITNGSKNALALYDLIMKTKNIKLIFLTGTPIVNHPFELVPCLNMCRGLLQLSSKPSNTTKLFDENPINFDNYFVDTEKMKVKNKAKFQNRIAGLVSYYGKMYMDDKKTSEDFPEQKNMIIEKVYMSDEQFAEYDKARDRERDEASRAFKSKHTGRFGATNSASSTYRVFSRQISNFYIPPEALTDRGGKKAPIKHIDKIPDSAFSDKGLEKYSPKVLKLMENIKKHKTQLGLIYSDFVSGEGLAVCARALEQRGYSAFEIKGGFEFNESPYFETGSGVSHIIGGAGKKYAIISGDIPAEDRAHIVRVFNGKDNIDGSKIHILMISSTGAEGLDLKNIRHVHILNPFWNYSRLDQVIARAVRYKSHEMLPKKDRNVQPYIYLSDYPKKYDPKKKAKELTTDFELYKKSVDNKHLIDHFLKAIIEASIDCLPHHENLPKSIKDKIKCRICQPNDKPLFENLLAKDMLMKDSCEQLKENQIKVQTIKYEDENFYYSMDKDKNLVIYEHDKELNGYIPMRMSNPIYPKLYKKIMKLE